MIRAWSVSLRSLTRFLILPCLKRREVESQFGMRRLRGATLTARSSTYSSGQLLVIEVLRLASQLGKEAGPNSHFTEITGLANWGSTYGNITKWCTRTRVHHVCRGKPSPPIPAIPLRPHGGTSNITARPVQLPGMSTCYKASNAVPQSPISFLRA